jgi:acyl-CoA thioester hydrolase
MYEYSRPVFYYETDQMGVVHHSNYARWVAEARTYFFDEQDLAYVVTESLVVMCPITDLNVKFKFPAKFGDVFTVKLRMIKYTGVRLRIEYEIINQDGKLLLDGESAHAFIDKDLRPVTLSKVIPERHERMKKLLEQQL